MQWRSTANCWKIRFRKQTKKNRKNPMAKHKSKPSRWMFMLKGGFLYLFSNTGVQSDFHVRWYSCPLTATRQVSLVEQELLTPPGHPSSPPVFSGVRVTGPLVFCVVFCRKLSFCLFSFGDCIVCPSIYGFWLLLCYIQPLLNISFINYHSVCNLLE